MNFPWFVAVCRDAPHPLVGEASEGQVPVVVSFASGRPWLAAYGQGGLVCAERGPRRLAVLGESLVTADRLGWLLDVEPDAVAIVNRTHAEPGSFSVLYTDGETTIAQGAASGVRELYIGTEQDGAVLVSDQASQVAAAVRAPVNRSSLAFGLLHPGLDAVIDAQTYWVGVSRIPAGFRTVVQSGVPQLHQWWEPPAAELTLEAGSELLATALASAVAVRVGQPGALAADLSGGMDSTSLCFLLAAAGAKFDAYVEQTRDPNHDDAAWAREAAAAIGAPLTVLYPEQTPQPYDGLLSSDGGVLDPESYNLSAPYSLIRNRVRKASLAQRVRLGGAQTHIAGFGGDELFTVAPAYFADLYATSRTKAFRQIRASASLRRWTWRGIATTLSERQTYAGWLVEQATRTDDRESQSNRIAALTWGPPVGLPTWATRQASELVRERLARAALHSVPHGRDRAAHAAVAGLRQGGNRLAPVRDLMASKGIALSAPLMDDAVVTAALSVSKHVSTPGLAYKPVLREAMRRTSQHPVFGRSTKGEFTMSVQAGIDKNREPLARLFNDSLLADLGYVDPGPLQQAIRDGMRTAQQSAALERTVAAETWLRAVDASGRLAFEESA